MPREQPSRVVEAIAREPWLITPDGFELVMSVAERHFSDPELAAVTRAARAAAMDVASPSPDVALLQVFGVLTPRASAFSEVSGLTGVARLQEQFAAALEDPKVAGIVLCIDSPGGQVAGIHEFARQVYAARGSKPVVAYVSALAASAAYWIACAADTVVADRTAQLGSIGCVMSYVDRSKAMEAAGTVEREIVSSQSPKKRLSPATKEGRAEVQTRVDEIAEIFIAEVALFRGVSPETVEKQFGQGGTLMAGQAVAVGMADRLGSLSEVIKGLRSGQSGSARLEAVDLTPITLVTK
jgi:signal peptide peptidase SppA